MHEASFHQILVPVDFSADSLAALRRGVLVAREDRATLRVQTVLHQRDLNTLSFVYGEQDVQKALVERFERSLRAAASEAGAHDVPVEAEVSLGAPFVEVLRTAVRQGTDLILIGKHGGDRGGMRWLGDTSYRVVRQAPCSVWVEPGESAAQLEAARGPVLVPTDFSDASAQAAHRAARLARCLGRPILFVHADDSRAGSAEVARDLDRLISQLDLVGVAWDVRTGDRGAAQLILDAAASARAGVIVIGGHGRMPMLRNLLLGGTVYQVVRRASCAVLVVKAATQPA